MKHNIFGEPVFQPSDSDIGTPFFEQFGTEPAHAVFTAEFIEEDETFGWSCAIQDQDGNELEVHDFKSEGALRAWLRENNIKQAG